MTTIIIHTKTLRESELDGGTLDDAEVYDANVNDYLSWLTDAVEREGFKLIIDDDNRRAASYTVFGDCFKDGDEAHDLMQSLPDFWQWYN